MVCESMAEDRSEGSISNTIKNDQFMSLDDYAPKARKPYTITKQRERWTDEEHKKFLEALKLYGRAWRKIEEHVGTKTAVQIRSHAQKFFSKVVRESTEVKPIEIPPPRPKRKPMHPYPRKLSVPIKMGGDNMRSSSPNSSGSDQENQSPTSVLSAGGSNTFVLGDSCSPNGGSSGSEPDHSPDENVSSPPVQEGDSSDPMNLESCVEEKGFANEGSPESGSTQSLKLFGKTVIITDTHTPSSPNSLPQNFIHVSSLPCGAPLYYMQFLDENSNSSITFDGGFPYPFVQSSNPIIPKNQNVLETQNEGSLTRSNTCSNTGSLSLGVSEIESGEQKKQKKPFLLIASERSAFTKQERSGSNDEKKKDMCRKGFVPYKRCLAQRDTHSTGGEEREEQRIRLCL